MRLEPATTKNGEGRTFYFTDDPRGRLLETRKTAGVVGGSRIVPWVFHRSGVAIRTLQQGVGVRLQGGGVPGATFHDFHRSAVRNPGAGVPEPRCGST